MRLMAMLSLGLVAHANRWIGCASAFVLAPQAPSNHVWLQSSPNYAYYTNDDPQVMASGYSKADDLVQAIQEATQLAMESLPHFPVEDSTEHKIDLAVIFVSSLYDGTTSPSMVVPALLDAASGYGAGIQHAIGSSAGGIVGSVANLEVRQQQGGSNCLPSELEGTLGVSVSLLQLPNVQLQTFHVLGADVPDDIQRLEASQWRRAVGLSGVVDDDDDPAILVLPSPAFQNDLDDLLQGLRHGFPGGTTFGALASTVSSLSRARLFRYDVADPGGMQTLSEGCVGVVLTGDIRVETMVAQGAKPVGGIYQVLKAAGSTIHTIVLDEAATALEREAREKDGDKEDVNDDDDEDDTTTDEGKKAQMAAAYAKASIPKPCLAEANFLMRALSDDDQAFMRRSILVGLERPRSGGWTTPSDLDRLRAGQGHRFEVKQVASAGMKDGSITLPLGSVDVKPGRRMRFFVREPVFAKKEVAALWMGYKKRVLTESFADKSDAKRPSFQPTGCFVFPTLDRGSKFFKGKPGFESGSVAAFVPELSSISGFFSNGVISKLDGDDPSGSSSVHGSASGYFLLGSKSGRPLYSPAAAAAERARQVEVEKLAEEAARVVAEEDEKRKNLAKPFVVRVEKAPRAEDGELILKRREVHSGRALTVSTVEWSVAEKQATPSSALESFMWDKETEVDRFRERVPLANLVSQCRLSAIDPTMPKPRDWIGKIKQASKEGFVVIPECKRMEPAMAGSLWKRYDAEKLARQFTLDGAPAICVNCDGILFGGSQDDVTKARNSASTAAVEKSSGDEGVVVPPILASDLILYPYQLYKLSLAGADAVNLVGGSLASKDLLYLTKIASSLRLQVLVTVTSDVQLRALAAMGPGSIDGVIISNRELEDFSFDMTGEQALRLLRGDGLKEVRKTHGDDVPVLVEGRVGVIERTDIDGIISKTRYLEELRTAGATGVIMGGGLAEGIDYASVREVASAL